MLTETLDITIPVPGGMMPAYIAVPAVTPAPALVLIPSVFGIAPGVRDTIDRYAENGFLTIGLDVYFRTVPGPKDRDIKAEFEEALARNKAYDHEAGVRDLAAVRDYALGRPECNGKWAVVGYCFGGRYAMIAGADLGADAVGGFHPSNLTKELDKAQRLNVPASFHVGDSDASVPMTDVEAVKAALAHNPRAEMYVYPGIKHGFSGKGGSSYDEAVAELSFERVLNLLDELKTS
jgi:carboxymethylenebutenolidase